MRRSVYEIRRASSLQRPIVLEQADHNSKPIECATDLQVRYFCFGGQQIITIRTAGERHNMHLVLDTGVLTSSKPHSI